MGLHISPRVKEKLKIKHCVSEKEIIECFSARSGKYLVDIREEHRTDPPTMWFVAETDMGRLLKVVFIEVDGEIHIKTAYEANEKERRIYEKYGNLP